MTEIKVVCQCGQKYKFDVEPVNGQMPFAVKCPICGRDGTAAANAILNEKRGTQPISLAAMAAVPPPPPPVTSPAPPPPPPIGAAGLRINRHAPEVAAAPSPAGTPPPPLQAAGPAIAPIKPLKPVAAAKPKKTEKYSLGMGILGAFVGAVLGGGLVYGFYLWAGFRFPLSGVAIGALAGYGARLLARGTDTTLGIIAGVLALISIVGVFWLIYGGFFIFGIISIVICVGVAYRLASG